MKSNIPWGALTPTDWNKRTDIEIMHAFGQNHVFTTVISVMNKRKKLGADCSYKGGVRVRMSPEHILKLGEAMKGRIGKITAKAATEATKSAAKAPAKPAKASKAKIEGKATPKPRKAAKATPSNNEL